MINKWILNNFKSINQQKVLNFRPLTIFTGANSSGKSTILQSILLVTQTLQDQIESRSIVLNGWFKKFGTYSDIVFHREDERNIEIGFEIEDDDNYSMDYMRFMRVNSDIDIAECRFVISSEGKKESLYPILKELNISSRGIGTEDKATELIVVHNPDRTEKELEVIEQCKSVDSDDNYFDYKAVIRGATVRFAYTDSRKWKPIGCSLSHFLPESIVRYNTEREYMKEKLKDYLTYNRGNRYGLTDKDERVLTPLFRDKAIEIVRNLRENGKLADVDQARYERILGTLCKDFNLQEFYALFKKSTLNVEEKLHYIDSLLEALNGLPQKYIIDMDPVDFNHPGPSFIKNFFSRRIKYLGPLREEPKSLYPLETSNTPMELGLKGENTAAVYENNKKRIIEYVDPSYFENGAMGDPKILSGRLSEAVAKWLVYLGVASRIITDDRGKTGHELKIMNELKDMRQDLTHVGVGVSQVLPILVMAFLAGKGDVIILEQPELHLHPKVQTRLADFFVSMTRLGKQCLIETHSEYFINRLRLLVAKADDTRIADDTMIYFVEKDHEQGYSKCREITINKYGKIAEWPDGFFDEGESLASQILEAAYMKRAAEKKLEQKRQ